MMRKSGLLVLTLCVVGFLATGCGGELSEKDTKRGWTAASAVLMSGQASAQTQRQALSLDDLGGSVETTQTDDSISVDFNFPCPEGGSAAFNGQLNGLSGGTTTFSYNVTYVQCGNDSVVIDGNLDFSLDVDSADGVVATQFVYSGQLDFSGDVQGSCEVDMVGTTSTSFGGSAGLAYQMEYSGHVCGHDANAVLSN